MSILKRENWWIWLLIVLFSEGVGMLVLGALLGVYDKNAWYAKWQNWLIGFVLFIFPAFIMLAVFIIQISVLTAIKLNVPGKEIYGTPYIWIICVIVPFIGWLALGAMSLWLSIGTLMALYNGEGEQYI